MTQLQLFQPPITLSELDAFLWEAANILRGSPVDRTDWKSYILPLLFFKHICNVWDEEYQEAVETHGRTSPRSIVSRCPKTAIGPVMLDRRRQAGTGKPRGVAPSRAGLHP